jgi:RsiW-degrading membrane proteinase PrsW (M82 family)
MSNTITTTKERSLRALGLTLLVLGIVVGGGLLLVTVVLAPLAMEDPASQYRAMLIGAVLAFPAALVYLTVPRLLDRYDPEPWYALLACFAWGAIAACGFSVVINSAVAGIARAAAGEQAGLIAGAVFSAPLVEEFFKGLGVVGVFFFLRREFDGVVDGIMYATFTALGFATIENVVYYAKAAQVGSETLAGTFAVRGILAPWGHPLYSSMLGLGIGMSRETTSVATRWLAPLFGFAVAVGLHAAWNASAVFAGFTGGALFLVTLPLWLLFVLGFLALVVVLVRRRGKIITRFLEDEVHLGNMTREEVALVGSAFGLSRARSLYGQAGVDFVRAAARLALSKWHGVRAAKSQTQTVSMAFIVPLRQRLAQLRAQVHSQQTLPLRSRH